MSNDRLREAKYQLRQADDDLRDYWTEQVLKANEASARAAKAKPKPPADDAPTDTWFPGILGQAGLRR